MRWPTDRLGELITYVPRPIEVQPAKVYREIGIRSHGHGIFHKTPTTGIEIGDKSVFAIEPGDFILNIVFAWEGAVALACKSEEGMIGSHRFPVFRAKSERIDLRYLLCYFRTKPGLDLLLRVSPGGAGRNRTLSKSAFLAESIPLPPKEEQQRLVALISELEGKIIEARTLKHKAIEEVKACYSSIIDKWFSEINFGGVLLDVLNEKPRNGWSAPCEATSSGTPVLSLTAVAGFQYQSTAHKRTLAITDPNARYWLEPGDLLISRSNTAELVGQASIYNGNPYPCIYPDLLMKLSVNSNVVRTEFVHLTLQLTRTRKYIKSHAIGTSPTMKKINQPVVCAIPFPTQVSIPEQDMLISAAKAVRSMFDSLLSLQDKSAIELKALIQSTFADVFDFTT